MRAARWHARNDLRVEEIPAPPPPGPGQVQVEIAYCGLCGTDLHEYLGGPLYIPVDRPHPLTGAMAPVVLGHEISGRVTAVGARVDAFGVGDRVAACPIIGCGECEYCRTDSMGQCLNVAFLGHSWHGGGFSEAVNLYAYQLFHLPDSVSDEAGSLVEPFSATVKAIGKATITPETSVAIVGAGPMGLLALQAARIAGARRVVSVEVAALRIETAFACGADAVINPATEDPVRRAAEITGTDGFDVVVEVIGRPETGLLAQRLTKTRGQLVVMGVFEGPAPFDYTDLVYKEKTVFGSMGGYGVYERAIEMMADPRFRGEAMISDVIKLDRIHEDGFRALIEEKDRHVKILVAPR